MGKWQQSVVKHSENMEEAPMVNHRHVWQSRSQAYGKLDGISLSWALYPLLCKTRFGESWMKDNSVSWPAFLWGFWKLWIQLVHKVTRHSMVINTHYCTNFLTVGWFICWSAEALLKITLSQYNGIQGWYVYMFLYSPVDYRLQSRPCARALGMPRLPAVMHLDRETDKLPIIKHVQYILLSFKM